LSRHDPVRELGDANRMTTLLSREVGTDRDVLVVTDGARDLSVLDETGSRVVRVPHLGDERDPILPVQDADQFDVVILDGAIAITPDPMGLLGTVRQVLKPGARLLVTADNVLHGARRLALLAGVWQGSAGRAGASLRHLDAESLVGLVRAAGFAVDSVQATIADPLSAGEAPVRALPAQVVEWVRDQPGAFERELLVAAVVGAVDDGSSPMRVDPAIDPSAVRRRDAYTRTVATREQELRDLQHRLLTMRDHVIGLEAEAVAARRRQQTAEVRAHRATARADRLKTRAVKAERKVRRFRARVTAAERSARRNRREVERELADLRASRSYRAGRLLTAPLRLFRRG
jgi:SAM-dependent methyltransferase